MLLQFYFNPEISHVNMKNVLMLVFLSITLMFLLPQNVEALTPCMEIDTIETAFERADMVFFGQVTSENISDLKYPSSDEIEIYTIKFNVIESFKGFSNKTISLTENYYSLSLGHNFAFGYDDIVFASGTSDSLTQIPCTPYVVPNTENLDQLRILSSNEISNPDDFDEKLKKDESKNVESFTIPPDLIPNQNMNSEGMSLESMNFFRTLYFAKLISMINQSIQSLTDDVFFDSTNKDDFQEILVTGDDNIYDLFSKSNIFYFDPKENINNFYEGTTKLSELKTRMDSSIGGNPSDDWIVDQNSQNQILEMIDYALDEYMQSVGGTLNPVSIEDYDENWWGTIRKYQENAKGHLGYLCYSESLKKPPNNEFTQIHFEIPECQIFIPKSLSLITQLRIGVPPEKIQCDEGLKLIFKSTDNSPVCVKPTTAEKLIERGWAK